MSQVVIKAEDISKLYRLGTLGTGSLKQDIKLWWQSSILKRQDPFFQTGTNLNGEPISNGYLWALKNVSFEIREGDVLGNYRPQWGG
jgi:lipopolysaccharide transport system ATP-binding protein